MPTCFGCNMCNKCGRFDDLLANTGTRTCPSCGCIPPEDAKKCPECGAPLPPAFVTPGVRINHDISK